VREGMLESLSVKKTGMAIALELGNPDDVHPKNKQEVGHRLALWALGTVYGRSVPATSGPLPTHWAREGNAFTVQFSHTEQGLVAKDGKLGEFEIAGEDRVWHPAEAKIAGTTVVVSSPEVAAPAAVRYAFSPNPTASLYNGAGLPATPFRTDRWPVK